MELSRAEAAARTPHVFESSSTMRLVAGYKLIVGLLLVLVAAEVFHLFDADLAEVAHSWILRLHANPHNPYVSALVEKVSAVDLRTLEEFVLFTSLFGAVHVIEGIGLWLSKAWAESLCVVSGSLCLPLEVQEIITEFHLGSILIFVLNVGVVVFLIRRLKHRRRAVANS